MARRCRSFLPALSLWALWLLCWPSVVTFLSASHSLFDDAAEVVDVSVSFGDLHEGAHLCPWMLLAYSSSCGHCRTLAPSIALIAKETFGNSDDKLNEVTVAAVDCFYKSDICKDLGAFSVPVLYLLVPSIMSANGSTLTPVVAGHQKMNASDAEAKHILMDRLPIGQGLTGFGFFDAARNLWSGLSANVWRATDKERCLYMRNYMRNVKLNAIAETRTGESPPAGDVGKFIEETAFHAVDVANAFFETLYHEVALVGLESAVRRHALFNFLCAVAQRLPGLGADVLLRAITTNITVNGTHNETGVLFLSVGDWQRQVLSAGIPYRGVPRELEWMTCKGSSWRYRGFPCGMWLLYHALTANAPSVDIGVPTTYADSNRAGAGVLFVILDYARHFFSCDTCLTHFLRFEPGGTDPMLQLWRFHNEVNQRLANVKEGADPLVAKRQFPTAQQCPQCIDHVKEDGKENSFVLTEVSLFLQYHYKWNASSLFDVTIAATDTVGVATNTNTDAPKGHPDTLIVNVLPIIFIVVAVLITIKMLRGFRSSRAKRRRPVLPFRGGI